MASNPIILTLGQRRFLDAIQNRYGQSAGIDYESTMAIRQTLSGGASLVSFMADLPDAEIKAWVVDVHGDVVSEHGAGLR